MADRDSMRVRKGDMKIDLQSLDVRITAYINRDTVKPEKIARCNERIAYLQHLSVTISADNWPQSLAEFEASVEQERQRKARASLPEPSNG